MKKILGICSIALMISSCQRAERETYLIPADFTGRVQIIFTQNGIPVKYQNGYGRDTIYIPKVGSPVKYEGGRRLYEIPENGILLTQFKSNDGFIDRKYFSIDKKGIRTPLEIFAFVHFKKDSAGYVVKNTNKRGVFGDGTSGSYGNANIAYQEFFISNYNMLDSIMGKEDGDKFEERLHKLTGSDF